LASSLTPDCAGVHKYGTYKDDACKSVDKSMYPSVASRELATITSDYSTEHIFYTDGSMIDNVAGFAMHNRNYETRHQLVKPFSVFSAEISAIRMALEHIHICPCGRYLILSDIMSSLMAMGSRRITCKTHPWVYESKQIYWDLRQLNYDVKLMWILSHVGILGNEVADGLARQAVESGTIHRQMTVVNDHRILARQAMVKQWQHVWRTGDTGRFAHSIDLWSRSNHGLMDKRRRGAL
jgi:ribonuclease HI